ADGTDGAPRVGRDRLPRVGRPVLLGRVRTGDSAGTGPAVSRRAFLTDIAAGMAAAQLLAAGCAHSTNVPATAGTPPRKHGRPNILFVFTDQERYFRKWPAGFTLPAREQLQETGVTFHNHYCPATMCTSSRSVLMTGLQTPDSRMFENVDLPW